MYANCCACAPIKRRDGAMQGAPLYAAVLHPYLEMIQALLSFGADMQLASVMVGRLRSKPTPWELCRIVGDIPVSS